MSISFRKYQGTGNDFIIIDAIHQNFSLDVNPETIAFLCQRRFGIGADGLMILAPDPNYNFRMIYYNSDGRESTMCGNGGRCISQMFFDLNLGMNTCDFIAIDGKHSAELQEHRIRLKMTDVETIECRSAMSYVLDTGSPHYVQYVQDKIELDNIVRFGKRIRYNDEFNAMGINVNMVFPGENGLHVATYERGVEDETYSCGTGVVASALSFAIQNNYSDPVNITTKGGNLEVDYIRNGNSFHDIWLSGPAKFVFEGQLNANLFEKSY